MFVTLKYSKDVFFYRCTPKDPVRCLSARLLHVYLWQRLILRGNVHTECCMCVIAVSARAEWWCLLDTHRLFTSVNKQKHPACIHTYSCVYRYASLAYAREYMFTQNTLCRSLPDVAIYVLQLLDFCATNYLRMYVHIYIICLDANSMMSTMWL